MKTFKQFFEDKEHAKGTYVSVKVSPKSAKELYTWCKDNGITNLSPKDTYHTTVVYSRVGIPEAKHETIKLPLNAKLSGWEIFPTQSGDKCLVARIKSPELCDLHDTYHDKYPATYDFDEYKPHITVSYDYKGEAPASIPNISLAYNKLEFKGLDPDWKAK